MQSFDFNSFLHTNLEGTSLTMALILCLYVAFRAKQLVCDFFLQTSWMALNKGKKWADALRPMTSHCGVHAVGTLAICLVFAPALWWLAVVDFFIHAAIDRAKAKLVHEKNMKPSDSWFWWWFGIDQEAHNFTHLAYVIIISAYLGGFIA